MKAIRPVHNIVKGRGRFDVSGLKRSERYKIALETHLRSQTGITHFSANPLTGRVLVHYDETMDALKVELTLAKVVDRIDRKGIDAFLPPSPLNPEKKETTAKKAMKKLAAMVQKDTDAHEEKWHAHSGRAVLEYYQSDAKKGISNRSVVLRRAEYGENSLPKTTSRSGVEIFCEQMNSLPVYLLGAAAGVSVLTGGLLDAAIIFGVVVANGVIGYVTESQAEKNIDALNDLVQHMAEVVRDGKSAFIPAEEVVPGDILVLKPGSYVAADSRILKAAQLTIDESMLTGESLPVEKTARPIKAKETALGDRKNMAFMGTCITGGQGIALVVATGKNTEIGKLKVLLNDTVVPQMPIERQLDTIGNQLILMSGAICTGVFGMGLAMGFGFLNMLRMSISLAAAAVPEGLPAMATINFAIGINRMKKNDIIVRQLPAVETLGAIQTICLDKTGTITKNQMKVTHLYAGDQWYTVDKDALLANGDVVSPQAVPVLEKLYGVCALCCETKINGKSADGRLDISGSATESALTELVDLAGIDVKAFRKASPLVQINHRSEKRLYMSTIHETSDAEKRLVMVKGSPLEVLSRCDFYMSDNQILPMSEERYKTIAGANEAMARDALRVLGFAFCHVNSDVDGELETQMTWLGLIGMMDPPRDGIRELIRQFHRAGVRTVMITGDQQISACAIADQLDLSNGEPLDILDAQELVTLDEEQLMERARTVHVFSRVNPSQKLNIVKAIQSSGQTVAMTGDGINDSPALKAADIGIAMGKSGTDLARDVADVVLTGDNLELMATTLADGRSIYQNIRKSVHYSLATNISEIQLIATAVALGMNSPLNVMQLLWINLISDILPGLALSAEKPETDVMDQQPREKDEALYDKKDFTKMMVESTTMTGSAMTALLYGISRYGAGARAGGLAFQALTIGQLLHAFTCRSESSGMFTRKKLPKNRYLDWAVGGSIALQVATMFFPPLRSLLGLTAITLTDGLVIGATSTLPMVINEVIKTVKEPERDPDQQPHKGLDAAIDITSLAEVEETPCENTEQVQADFKNLCN